jgi:hypothetical protein
VDEKRLENFRELVETLRICACCYKMELALFKKLKLVLIGLIDVWIGYGV